MAEGFSLGHSCYENTIDALTRQGREDRVRGGSVFILRGVDGEWVWMILVK